MQKQVAETVKALRPKPKPRAAADGEAEATRGRQEERRQLKLYWHLYLASAEPFLQPQDRRSIGHYERKKGRAAARARKICFHHRHSVFSVAYAAIRHDLMLASHIYISMYRYVNMHTCICIYVYLCVCAYR